MSTRRVGWSDQPFGSTTRAFDEWRLVDGDLRTFLSLTTKWMDERFASLWREIGERPGDPEGPDHYDVFYDEVGIDSSDYHWILRAAVVRDAVSAFEIYLEKASEEVLRRARLQWKLRGGRSPNYNDIVEFYRSQLGVDVGTTEVRRIRQLRHILTHQRGELRTKEAREQFGSSEDTFPDYRVELLPPAVAQVLDDLGGVVRQADQAAWQYIYGSARLDMKVAEGGA